MGIGEQSANTLALVIHELATNSLKYGALSVTSGMLDISGTSTDEEVCLVWTERGGPSVASKGDDGYGSKLLNRSGDGPTRRVHQNRLVQRGHHRDGDDERQEIVDITPS